MNKFFFGFTLLLTNFNSITVFAQTESLKKSSVYKIGIFAPLYLDSVFTKNTFKYTQSIPQFISPAVEFVQGALIALDSLQAGEDFIDASIYDTKSFTEKIPHIPQNISKVDINLYFYLETRILYNKTYFGII